MDNATALNRRRPSPIPGRVEHHSVNSSEIVKFLLKTNDGRSKGQVGVYSVLPMFQLKPGSGRGVSHHTAYMGKPCVLGMVRYCFYYCF